MTDDAPPLTQVIGLARDLLRAFPPLHVANDDLPHDQRLNGTPHWHRGGDLRPLPVLDLDVGHDEAWRRLRLQVVRSPGTAPAAGAPDP